jgi:phosphomannomutase
MGDLASIVKAYDIRGVDERGEINSVVADQAAATARVKAVYADRPGISADELDGLTVSAATWWFNLRPSNTEPLLRLNAEADTQAAMAALRDEVLGLVRETTARSDSARPGDPVAPGGIPDPNHRGGKI